MSSSNLLVTSSQTVKKINPLGLQIEIENDLFIPKGFMKIGASQSRTLPVTDLSTLRSKRVKLTEREEIATLKEQLQRVEGEKQKALEQLKTTSEKLDASTKDLASMASTLEKREKEQLELSAMLLTATNLISAQTQVMTMMQERLLMSQMSAIAPPFDIHSLLSTTGVSRLNASHYSTGLDDQKTSLKRKKT